MLTEKDYCDYETCVALKDFGYDDSTDLRYNSYGSLGDFLGGIKAPTLYEAQKWLREEKGIIVGIINNFTIQAFDYYVSTWDEDRCRGNKYSSYEDALQRGIKEAIKLLKEEY